MSHSFEQTGFQKEETLSSVEAVLSKNIEWTRAGFDLQKALDQRTGGFLEVAGPTWHGYKALEKVELPKPIYTSNFYPQAINQLPLSPDLLADAGKLPVKDEGLGALFASNMSEMTGEKSQPNLWEEFINEGVRTLEPGGLLVVQGMPEAAARYAERAGLELAYAHHEFSEPHDEMDTDPGVDENGNPMVWARIGGVDDFIFEKPALKPQ